MVTSWLLASVVTAENLFRLTGDWMQGTEVVVPGHGPVARDAAPLRQTRAVPAEFAGATLGVTGRLRRDETDQVAARLLRAEPMARRALAAQRLPAHRQPV